MTAETKHSPEPWKAERVLEVVDMGDHETTMPFVSIRGPCNGGTHGLGRLYHEADTIRAAACVSACAGLPTEALEAGALAKALDLAQRYVALLHSDYCSTTCRCGEERSVLRALGRLP